MTIQLTTQQHATITLVKVDRKSDIDKITSTFDCYEHSQEPEAILDTTCILDDEEANATAEALFGKAQWEDIAGGLILFHG